MVAPGSGQKLGDGDSIAFTRPPAIARPCNVSWVTRSCSLITAD